MLNAWALGEAPSFLSVRPAGGSPTGLPTDDAHPAVELPLATPFQIRELKLQTATELEQLLPFYDEILGLPIASRSDSEATIAAGATRITFGKVPPTGELDPYYHVAFNIPENKIERSIEWSRDRFELIHMPGVGEPVVHFRNIDAHSVYFWDPAGNLLEFIARHAMGNAATGTFGSGDILNASEIGLVVDDVEGTATELNARLGTRKYPPARAPSDAFSAIGDDNGTLILVRRKRVWLMTEDLLGEVFPTEIELAATSSGSLQLEDYPYRIWGAPQ